MRGNAVELVTPHTKDCLALADTEGDLRTCRIWREGKTNVTGCTLHGRGVGRINGEAGADFLPAISGGGDLNGSLTGRKSVPSGGESNGTGRVGIGGIVEVPVTVIATCGTGAGIVLDPDALVTNVVAGSDTDGG